MSDRQWIELAAKAAGIPGAWSEQHQTFHIAGHLRGPSDEARAAREAIGLSTESRMWWAPGDDPGDALRLAVVCGIRFGRDAETGRMRVEWIIDNLVNALVMPKYHPLVIPPREIEWLCGAIVKAAAQLGARV